MEGNINKSTTDETLINLIQNLNNNYVHWDKFRDMNLPVSDKREDIWNQVQIERNQGVTRRLYCNGIEVTWWLSNSMEALLHHLDIALAGGRGLESVLDNKHVHRHRTSALLEESIASAMLAGTTITKKVAKEMLLKKRPPQDIGEQICVNIYRTLQLAYSKKQERLSEELLLQLHYALTKDSIKQKGVGRYRTNNKVDESTIDVSAGYKWPDATQMNRWMPFVINLYNEDNTPFFIHPLVKATIIHFLLVTIRPFRDANGRLARLLAQMYLLKSGYWVAEFISISNIISKFKLQYHKSIVQSQQDGNNMGYFMHFYIQAVQMAHKSLRDFVQRIRKEGSSIGGIQIPGYNERQIAVLQWLKEDAEKVITIRELRSVYGVSKETARTDLTGLVNKGWIRHYNINKKTYAFVKGDSFEELIHNNG